MEHPDLIEQAFLLLAFVGGFCLLLAVGAALEPLFLRQLDRAQALVDEAPPANAVPPDDICEARAVCGDCGYSEIIHVRRAATDTRPVLDQTTGCLRNCYQGSGHYGR